MLRKEKRKMNKPEISERFDVEDIRKIREYNSLRHAEMTTQEIIEETRSKAEIVLQRMENRKKALKV